MLDGVTILNQEVVMDVPMWSIILFVGGLLLALFSVVIASNTKSELCEKIFGGLAILGLTCFVIIFIIQPEVETDRYRYEVTVGPYVRFTDIYEKYNVVERRGEIWVLEDKENE